MKQYTYFPGCSCSEGGAKFYNLSAQAVARVFDAELVMLENSGHGFFGDAARESISAILDFLKRHPKGKRQALETLNPDS